MTTLPTHVDIREVSLRDGLQIETPVPLSAKLDLLGAVAATGVREVEVTAFVSPTKVPALADAAELAAELWRFPDIEFSALVAGAGGAKRAVASGLRTIEYVVSAADGHSHANVGRSSAEATALIADIVAIAHDSGVTVEVIIATAWDCPFDGPTPPRQVLDIVSRATEFGADRLAVADTIGTANPLHVEELLTYLQQRYPGQAFVMHVHDTRGMGLANCLKALEMGIHRFESSAGGLGGCPFAPGAAGNIATEDLVNMLHEMKVSTGIDADKLLAAVRLIADTVKFPLESHTAKTKQIQHNH